MLASIEPVTAQTIIVLLHHNEIARMKLFFHVDAYERWLEKNEIYILYSSIYIVFSYM